LQTRSFDAILIEVMMETLSSLGESVSQAILFFLETGYGIEMKNVPQRTRDFDATIGALLGTGATYLEAAMLNQLYTAIGDDGSLSSGDQRMSFGELVGRAADYYRSKVNW